MKNLFNTKSSEKLNSKLISLMGQNLSITTKTAEFIRDSGMYTGNKFRNMQMWATEYEFSLNGNIYTLYWADKGLIFISQGLTFN